MTDQLGVTILRGIPAQRPLVSKSIAGSVTESALPTNVSLGVTVDVERVSNRLPASAKRGNPFLAQLNNASQ